MMAIILGQLGVTCVQSYKISILCEEDTEVQTIIVDVEHNLKLCRTINIFDSHMLYVSRVSKRLKMTLSHAEVCGMCMCSIW